MPNFHEFLRQLPVTQRMDPLLVFGVVLIAGAVGGWLARRLRLPALTGNILAGVLIGPSALGVVGGESTLGHLAPLSNFAMGLITVAIGGHLSYRRLHNAWRRIVLIALGETLFCFAAVAAAVWLFSGRPLLAVLLGALAMATAPGASVALMRECRAKGSFVKTLLSVVAMDNILTIVCFSFCLTLLRDALAQGGLHWRVVAGALLHPMGQLAGSLGLGVALGMLTRWMIHRPQFSNFGVFFIAILLCTGLARALALDPLLTSLFFGMCLGNGSREAEEQLNVLAPIEGLIYVTFFTLAGVMLHLGRLPEAGLLGAVYFFARIAGKGAGAMLGGALARASRRICMNMPLGLVPQAGLVIALLVAMQEQSFIPASTKSLVTTMVLAAVVVNEIAGPLTVRLALQRSREINMARPRLVEFIQEEFILVDLEAADKWAAIRRLCDFLILTHRVEHITPAALLDSVVEREQQQSTAIGRGVAIPHGIIDQGPEIQGVLGISRRGIDFGAPDGQPVNIIMLICTPRGRQERHLQVMASLAEMVSDSVTRARLITAASANDAWEILEYSERADYNQFLEE